MSNSRCSKKPMLILPNFVVLLSVLSYFQTNQQKFSGLRRNFTFLALSNGILKGLTNKAISIKKKKKKKTYFQVLKDCYPCLSSPLNLPLQLNRSSALKLTAHTISCDIYSDALRPQMCHIASKIRTACVTYETIPKIWRLPTVIFTNPGKAFDG